MTIKTIHTDTKDNRVEIYNKFSYDTDELLSVSYNTDTFHCIIVNTGGEVWFDNGECELEEVANFAVGLDLIK